VEVLLKDLKQLACGTELGAVDPVGESAVSQRVQSGADVDRLYPVGDCMRALQANVVNALACHENLEGQIKANEKRDEVHEDLIHLVPDFVFAAVFIFADEELTGGVIEAAFIHPQLDAFQDGLVYFDQKITADFVYTRVPILLHALDEGRERVLLEASSDVFVDLVDYLEAFDWTLALKLQ